MVQSKSVPSNMQDLRPHQELALAIKLASENHLKQKDRGGMPYILHPLRVMHELGNDDLQLMAIGILHDILEDTKITAYDLVMLGFTNRVKDAVLLLTKKQNLTEEEYIEGICTNYDAIRVKLADLKDNMDVKRLKSLSDKDLVRLKKYHEMHLKLVDARKRFEGK